MHAQRICDMPCNSRPREKMLNYGPASLDNAELLALFLSTGTRGKSAIEIGRDLLAKHGSIGALGSLLIAELAKEHGLGIAKASKLLAAFELGARVSREQMQHASLDSPESIHRAYAPQLQHLSHEQVMVATLDTRLRHLGSSLISSGSVNESIAHPRDILRPVITRSAHGFVLIHNHPSGDPAPSRADQEVTRRVSEAASLMQVRFVDHIIIGKPQAGRNAWYSFREAGILS